MSIALDPTEYANDAAIDSILGFVEQHGIITGPIGRNDELSHRWYIKPSNTEFICESITAIIGDTTEKPYLKKWAAAIAAEAAVNNINHLIELMGVSPIIDENGNFWGMSTPTPEGRTAAIKWLKGESERLRELASAIGTYQHDVLEGLILDAPGIPIPQELLGVTIDGESVDHDGWSDGLLNAMTDFDMEPIMAEATVCNTLHELAGTLDLMVIMRAFRQLLKDLYGIDKENPIGIGDLKTGKNLYEKPIREQLNAYMRCDEVWLDHLGNTCEMPEVDFLFVLHLRPEFYRGYKFRLVPKDEVAWKRFLNRREVLRGGTNDTKFLGTVVYPPLPDGSQPLPMIEDVPALGRCAKSLAKAGFLWMSDLEEMTEADLLTLKGVGPAAVRALNEQLLFMNLSPLVPSSDEDLLAIKGFNKKSLAVLRGITSDEQSDGFPKDVSGIFMGSGLMGVRLTEAEVA